VDATPASQPVDVVEVVRDAIKYNRQRKRANRLD